MVTDITIRLTKSAKTPTAPLPKTSDKASTSLVNLVSNLPTGILSWKRKDNDMEWANKSFLIRAVNLCPTDWILYDWNPCNPSLSNTVMNSIAIIRLIVNSLDKFLKDKVESFEFEELPMSIEIPYNNKTPSTFAFTFKDKKGKNIITNGLNLILNSTLLTIKK